MRKEFIVQGYEAQRKMTGIYSSISNHECYRTKKKFNSEAPDGFQ